MEQIKKTEEELEIWLDTKNIGPKGDLKGFITSVGDLKILIYPNDHDPPHFHVRSTQRRINATFNLHSLDLLKDKGGEVREKDVKLIKKYFELHPERLKYLRGEYNRLRVK